jgi:type IV secretory pathway VirB6-like protein
MSRDSHSSALAEDSHDSMPKKELQQQPKIHPGAKKSVIFYRKSEAKSSKGCKTGPKKTIVQHQQNYETL